MCAGLNYVAFGVFTAVTVKSVVFWDVALCGSCKTDVSQERFAYIFRVEKSKSEERR
jgi:hypothetical protein